MLAPLCTSETSYPQPGRSFKELWPSDSSRRRCVTEPPQVSRSREVLLFVSVADFEKEHQVKPQQVPGLEPIELTDECGQPIKGILMINPNKPHRELLLSHSHQPDHGQVASGAESTVEIWASSRHGRMVARTAQQDRSSCAWQLWSAHCGGGGQDGCCSEESQRAAAVRKRPKRRKSFFKLLLLTAESERKKRRRWRR